MKTRFAALLLGGIVLSGIIALCYRTYHYVENDPRFCQSCHLMQEAYDKWEVSVHREIGCHACHRQSLRESVEQLYKFITLRPTEVTKHAEVDFSLCGTCHLSQDPRWKQVAETAGHKVHFERLGLQCVDCHSRGVHKFVRPTEACRECHVGQVIKVTGMAEFHCTTCHNFLAVDHELKTPTRRDCLECHQHMQVREEVFSEKSPMLFPCRECHKPHVQPVPTPADCLHCHHIRAFGFHQVEAHGECISCHQPHLWQTSARETCEQCHVDREAHHPGTACSQCHSFSAGACVG